MLWFLAVLVYATFSASFVKLIVSDSNLIIIHMIISICIGILPLLLFTLLRKDNEGKN